jgi:glutamate racemase
MKKKTYPIGMFDSGVGGLTVVKAAAALLPHESIVYFGDTAHVPYGTKSKQHIEQLSTIITSFLVKQKVKMVVVACNTASSYALKLLQSKFDLPVIGVIEPGVNAALSVNPKKIGIIGTEGTIRSKSYENLIREQNKTVPIFAQPCPLFVPLVEEGWFKTNREIVTQIVRKYLKPFQTKNIDTLILGCTHYPLLAPIIKDVVYRKVNVVDSAKSTASAIQKVLEQHGLTNDSNTRPKYTFYVSDSPEKFVSLAHKFIDKSSKILPTIKNTSKTDMEIISCTK